MRKNCCLCIVALALAASGLAVSAAEPQQQTRRSDRTRPWHVQLPRDRLLATWARLKTMPIPGLPLDLRLNVTGQSFYVSPRGDDQADGSRQDPWRTLRHAVGQLQPNTVLYLERGTYFGPVRVRASGTAEAPVAIRAVEGHEVVVTYSDEFVAAEKVKVHTAPTEGRERALDRNGKELHYPPLIDVKGPFVEISRLHLVGVRDRLPHNLYSENGVSFSGRGSEGCRVLDCEIENVGHCGVKEMGRGGHSILIAGNLIHDLGQTFHDHGIYVPADDVAVHKNLLLNTTGWGLHAYSRPRRTVATHNIVAGNAWHGVLLAGPDALVAHNVFVSNRQGGLFFFRSLCTGARVKNNLFYDDPAVAFDQLGDARRAPSGNVFDYNCLVPGIRLGSMSPKDKLGSHNLQVDPRVVDAQSLDFRLAPGSPCIDAGTGIGSTFRGKAPDIGLFETR